MASRIVFNDNGRLNDSSFLFSEQYSKELEKYFLQRTNAKIYKCAVVEKNEDEINADYLRTIFANL